MLLDIITLRKKVVIYQLAEGKSYRVTFCLVYNKRIDMVKFKIGILDRETAH